MGARLLEFAREYKVLFVLGKGLSVLKESVEAATELKQAVRSFWLGIS